MKKAVIMWMKYGKNWSQHDGGTVN